MVARYFAYGSNMNPERVRERGIEFEHACGARLPGYALVFDKTSRKHAGVGHANLLPAPGRVAEGVLYFLRSPAEIGKMDRFESTPINYSREIIRVAVESVDVPSTTAETGGWVATWTYFANPAVRQPALKPPRSYLEHLLAGRPYLSAEYYEALAAWPCDEAR